MTAALVLAVYALIVGAAAPYVLARAGWAHDFPGVAVLAWQGLMVTFVVTTALAVYHVVLGEQHVHDGLLGLLSACGMFSEAPEGASAPTMKDAALLLVPALIVVLPIGWLAHTAWRIRRVQRRQLDMLTLIGTHAPEYDATIVEHGTPAVYCLPGRFRRVVVTRGAVEVLTPAQLHAVLEHERAHIVGRHHLIHAVTEAFARAFPMLPLARHAREQTALLLEMIADDRALRSHPPEVLAVAMCEVAAGQAPSTAFGAGGASALIRMRRVLAHPETPHRTTAWLSVSAGVVVAPVLPLIIACGPAVG